MASVAEVEFTEDENDSGQLVPCVFVRCLSSPTDFEVGPIWGNGIASVRRALAQLSEDCDCGQNFHKADQGEDEFSDD